MEGSAIVELYWQRDENAIAQTEMQYGSYLRAIAFNILANDEDCGESLNDTYLSAWESIPPHKPGNLRTYLGHIIRQIAIDRYRRRSAQKRIGSEYALSLDELAELIPGGDEPSAATETAALAGAISDYLLTCPKRARQMFVCRYYFADSIDEIAGHMATSASAVKSSLFRTRAGLKTYLTQEGFI